MLIEHGASEKVSSRSAHFALVDVCLAAVHDPDDAELDRDDQAVQHVHRVSALVHQVQLRQHADRARALGVHLARQLQRCTQVTRRVRPTRVGR